MSTATFAISITCSSVRLETLRRSTGTSLCMVSPVLSFGMCSIIFGTISLWISCMVPLSTMNLSGRTIPATRASPSPHVDQHLIMREAFLFPVEYCTWRVEAAPAFLDIVYELILASHVEVGVLLPGERCVW